MKISLILVLCALSVVIAVSLGTIGANNMIIQRIVEADGNYYKPKGADRPEFDNIKDNWAMYGYAWLKHENRYAEASELHVFGGSWKWVDEKDKP